MGVFTCSTTLIYLMHSFVYSEILAMISTSRKMWYSYAITRGSAPVLGRSRSCPHLISDLDGHSTESREDDTISSLDGYGDDDTITVRSPGADGEDEGLGRGS